VTVTLSSGWRKASILGAFLFAASVPGFGQGSPLICNASTVPVTVRAGGAAERTSDLLLTCTGGTPTAAQQTVLPMTWVLTFNANVTSRPLATGWSDALLVVDEPKPATQSACSTANGICSIISTGNPQRTYDGTAGRPNIFQGEYGANTLTWRTVPFDPPGNQTTRSFRFTNLRVATPVAGGTLAVSVVLQSGQLNVSINNSNQTVATAQAPIVAYTSGAEASGGRLSKFLVNVAEQFANVLKPNSSAGAGLSPGQSESGGVPFDFETGFYNPNLAPSQRGNLSFAGLPDNGTRLRVRLFSVPISASVSAPVAFSFGSFGVAQLIIADANGIGPYSTAQTTALANDKGTVTAVYEITQSAATVTEALAIPFTIAYGSGAPLLQSLNGDLSLAPVSASQIADVSPIPRFNNPLAFSVTAPRDPLSFVTTSLLNGAVGSPYSQTIETAGGLLPHTFTSVPVTPAPGLTLGSNGLLTGTPTASGTFSFAVTVRDAAQVSATKQFSLTIGAAGSVLQTSLSKLDFSSILGGGTPPLQAVRISTAQAGQAFSVTVDGGSPGSPTPSWIQVTPTAGTAPGLITISVNQTNLPEGSYSARIRISIPSNPNVAPVDVFVNLSVKPVAAKLESSVSLLSFATRAPSPGKRQGSLLLRNAGGGGSLPFTAVVQQRSAWIASISPATGTAGPLGTAIRINVDTTGLTEGIYRDTIRFTSSINNVDVPIVLRIAPAGPLLDASPTGVRFSMREGARTLAVREIKVFNREPLTNLPWTAEWLRGSEYFSLASTSGSAALIAPSIVKVSVKPETANLPTGAYYGLLRITAPGAAYSPRYAMAVLQVKAANVISDLDLDVGGHVFTAITGAQPSRHVVTLNAASLTPIPYQAAASTLDGTNWLTVSPTTGNISSTQSAALAVTVDPRTLVAGIYRGEITIATADASQTVSVTLIVTDAASDQIPSARRAAACSPNKMAVGTTGLANNFTVPAGWPAQLTVEVRDNCGAAVSNATVVARFSNGDPPMTLDPDDVTGIYSATWQPGTALEQTNVTISALNADFPTASATLVGSVKQNAVPTLDRGGTVNPFNRQVGGLLAPGTAVEIYGSSLATATEGTFVPLPTLYKGSSVLVGALDAPLYFVTPGQLNAQLPYELVPNRSYPIVVSSGGAITIPDLLDVVPIQPAVGSFADGNIIAQHSSYILVDSTNPAKRGEYLIMYLVGLGATNPKVASGAPSPGVLPLGIPTVLPTVTIDGATAEVAFAGLTPFGVGLYQINFKVPDNARLNAPLEVLVKQASYTANVTTLTVVP